MNKLLRIFCKETHARNRIDGSSSKPVEMIRLFRILQQKSASAQSSRLRYNPKTALPAFSTMLMNQTAMSVLRHMPSGRENHLRVSRRNFNAAFAPTRFAQMKSFRFHVRISTAKLVLRTCSSEPPRMKRYSLPDAAVKKFPGCSSLRSFLQMN